MNRKILETAVKFLIGGTFLAPLIVMSDNFVFPFIVPKIIFFRTLVLLMLGTYVLLLAVNWKKYRPKLTPLTLALSAFYLSFLVSTFVGVDWYRSFWDNHERMLGLFTVTHYVLYYFVVTSVIREWRDWKVLLRFFLLAGGAVMIIALYQKLVDPEFLLNQGRSRVQSTLGNSIYLGGYGIFMLFLTAVLYFREQERVWKGILIACGLLGLSGIFTSGSRGPFLALIAGGGLMALTYLIGLKSEYKKVKQAIVGGLVALVVIMGIAFLFRDTSAVLNTPVLGRLVNTDVFAGGDKVNERILAWGTAIDAWKERPVLGWGPNNYYYAFNKYYDPRMLDHGWGQTWFDNAHNIIVNTLAVQGAVGVLTYFSIFVAGFFYVIRTYKKDDLDIHMTAAIVGFFGAHLVSNVFVFENPTSYIYFMFFLAFANAQTLKPSSDEDGGKTASGGLAVLVFSIALLLVYATDVKPARANMASLDAIQFGYGGRLAESSEAFDRALGFGSPHVDDIRNDFARMVERVERRAPQNGEEFADAFAVVFAKAHSELKQNYDLHPMDIRVHLMDAQLTNVLSKRGEPEKLSEAIGYLEEAKEFSPKRQQVIYMLSILYTNNNQYSEAVGVLQQSIEDNARIGEGYWRLAALLFQTGNVEQSRAIAEEALRVRARLDKQGKAIINQVLRDTGGVPSNGQSSPEIIVE